MRPLTIGLAQVRQSADLDANEQTILRTLERAGAAGVQILCFPEGQTVGYRVDVTPPDAPVPVERLVDLHARVARRCGELGMACVLGIELPTHRTRTAVSPTTQPSSSLRTAASSAPTTRRA